MWCGGTWCIPSFELKFQLCLKLFARIDTNSIIMWKICFLVLHILNILYIYPGLSYIFTFNGKSLTLTTRTCPSSSVNLKSSRLVCNWRHQSLSNPTYQHRSQSWVKQSGDRLFFHMSYVMDMFTFRISDGLAVWSLAEYVGWNGVGADHSPIKNYVVISCITLICPILAHVIMSHFLTEWRRNHKIYLPIFCPAQTL